MYIDESGFAQDMPRNYGYAPVGERCFGRHDWNAKGRINVVGALMKNNFLNVNLVDGDIDADVFYARVSRELLPGLPEGSVVVMDNAAFHKRGDIQEIITSSGHELEFLPSYSPDLNPVEHKRAQAEALRKKLRCPVDELFQNDIL